MFHNTREGLRTQGQVWNTSYEHSLTEVKVLEQCWRSRFTCDGEKALPYTMHLTTHCIPLSQPTNCIKTSKRSKTKQGYPKERESHDPFKSSKPGWLFKKLFTRRTARPSVTTETMIWRRSSCVQSAWGGPNGTGREFNWSIGCCLFGGEEQIKYHSNRKHYFPIASNWRV